MKRNGLTVIELLVVMAILAIMAGLIVTMMGGCRGSQYYSQKQTATYQCVKTYTTNENVGDSVKTHKRVDMRPVSGGQVLTFQVDDDWWQGIHNSATLFAQFEAGKWYSVSTVGYRREGYIAYFPLVTAVAEVPDPRK